MPRKYLVIRGRFLWADLDKILGKPEYGLQIQHTDQKQPCGLLPGLLSYKIYYTWKENTGGCSAHVCKHSDGVCFSGSLNINEDWEFAEELYRKVQSSKLLEEKDD